MSSLPSVPWTDIDSTRSDQDSPGSEDLFQDIIIDLNYLKAAINTFGTVTYTVAGTYTWVAPYTGIVTVELWGAGGGGGRVSGFNSGGGSGAYQKRWVPVVAGVSYTVTVGAGGAGGGSTGSAPNDGLTGGASWFSTALLNAAGGSGTVSGNLGPGGAAASNIFGQAGTAGIQKTSDTVAGAGGSSPFGVGTGGVAGTLPNGFGGNGTGNGSGGGGARTGGSQGYGGNGAPGMVVLTI